MKAVFDVNPELKYRSDISRQFRFLSKAGNLEVARSCLNDWILYRETKRGGGHGSYFAVAFATGLQSDPLVSGYSLVSVTNFLRFPIPVGFKIDGRYAETQLLGVRRPVQVGAMMQGKVVRHLYGADFGRIIRLGFATSSDMQLPAEPTLESAIGFFDQASHVRTDWRPHRLEATLQSRLFRDAVFRKLILHAYDRTCAITATINTDGADRYEAQAAHLWPVAAEGPDIEQNGIAVSGTAHWLLDKHAFTLNPDFTVRIMPGLIDPRFRALLPADGQRIRLPADTRLWPHAEFLDHHRAAFERRHGL